MEGARHAGKEEIRDLTSNSKMQSIQSSGFGLGSSQGSSQLKPDAATCAVWIAASKKRGKLFSPATTWKVVNYVDYLELFNCHSSWTLEQHGVMDLLYLCPSVHMGQLHIWDDICQKPAVRQKSTTNSNLRSNAFSRSYHCCLFDICFSQKKGRKLTTIAKNQWLLRWPLPLMEWYLPKHCTMWLSFSKKFQ